MWLAGPLVQQQEERKILWRALMDDATYLSANVLNKDVNKSFKVVNNKKDVSFLVAKPIRVTKGYQLPLSSGQISHQITPFVTTAKQLRLENLNSFKLHCNNSILQFSGSQKWQEG